MSIDLVNDVALELTPPLAQPIFELRRSQQALSVLVNRLFEDLDVRRAQLEQQAQKLRSERADLAGLQKSFEDLQRTSGEPAARLQQRLAQAEFDLQAARSEIARYRERLAAALAAQAAHAADDNSSGQSAARHLPRLEELERERNELQKSLDAARTQIGQLAAAALDLADARAQIATLREQLLEARSQSTAAVSECDARRQQQIHELEFERRALRAELETVRRQAAELTENLAESRRQFAEQRSHWSNELRELRRLLERQPGSVSDGVADERNAPNSTATDQLEPPANPPASDKAHPKRASEELDKKE